MAKQSRRRPTGDLVAFYRTLAESFLKRHQDTGKGPPGRFSGFLTPRFGEFVMVWQYRNNKLIGCTAVHLDSVNDMAKKLGQASKAWDYANIPVESVEEIRDEIEAALAGAEKEEDE